VLEINGVVTDINGEQIRPGEAVTFLDVHGTCYNCWYCLVAKQSTRCPHRRVYGITYGADEGLLGGWSERIYLKPGVKIVKMAANVSPELWIAGGCGLPTALHAIDLARIKMGDRVVVQGAGPVGLSACALAAASGASWVGVIDAVPHRLEAAKRMGADTLISLGSDVLSAVHQATGGRGADVVIEASGNPNAVPMGCRLARDGGRYIVVGQYSDNGPAEINPHSDINRRHLTLQGCWGVDFSHVYRAMEALARFGDRFAWTDIISARYSLADAGAALAAVESREVVKALIVA
jgi:threonine dehydrogenase-like Zn-dependent dehydrogenase